MDSLSVLGVFMWAAEVLSFTEAGRQLRWYGGRTQPQHSMAGYPWSVCCGPIRRMSMRCIRCR